MAILGSYTVGATIGRGEFATVKLGTHIDSGRQVAIKFLDKSRIDQEKVQLEIRNQQRMCHKHIIKIEEVIESEDSFCVVLEYAPGGDLFEYIVRHLRLKECEAKRVFRQLVDGLAHCHEKMVVHRDLKPENILMDDDFNVKIADFGLSGEWCAGKLLTESCGSPNYAAPELLSKGCEYEGPEIDVWSCGVILYALLCGALPFDDDNIPQLFQKIKQGRYSIPGYLSADVKDLLIKMLTVDRSARISLQQVCEHDWLKDESNVPPEATALEDELNESNVPPEDTPLEGELNIPAEATPDTLTASVASVEPAGGAVDPTEAAVAVQCAGAPRITAGRCSRATKSALQLSASGDRSRCRRLRTGSGRLGRQYSASPSSPKIASWGYEALRPVKSAVCVSVK